MKCPNCGIYHDIIKVGEYEIVVIGDPTLKNNEFDIIPEHRLKGYIHNMKLRQRLKSLKSPILPDKPY